jgi:hypothetical protein
LEQRKQKNREAITELYNRRSKQMEWSLIGSSPYVEDQLTREVEAFEEKKRRNSMDTHRETREARVSPIYSQFSRVQNIMYETPSKS